MHSSACTPRGFSRCAEPSPTWRHPPNGSSSRQSSSEAGLEELTRRLVEALAQGVPKGALWLVAPMATYEIPAPYLKGPAEASPRPRRLDA
jgi:hypothetical protein